jgi:cytochrome P450
MQHLLPREIEQLSWSADQKEYHAVHKAQVAQSLPRLYFFDAVLFRRMNHAVQIKNHRHVHHFEFFFSTCSLYRAFICGSHTLHFKLRSCLRRYMLTLQQISVAQTVYNLYFHPLADYPGPKSWAACRLRYIYSMVNGKYVQDLQRIHRRYGHTVRIAPDELSFARPQAWHDIFERPDHLTFPKDPIWYRLPDGRQDPSLAMTTNIADHARMRKLMENGFTFKALKAQESIIQSYVTLLVTRLREKAAAAGTDGGVVNMVDWFNFTTFDIVGDLSFGESFDCLKNSNYHPWVAMIIKYLKAIIISTMARFYPTLETIGMKMTPPSLLKTQRDHYQLAVEKVHRRLNLETTRKDFVTPLIENNKDMQFMTMAEIEATLSIIIIAGSETSATALSGIINSLIQDAPVLHKLVTEIRGIFPTENDITMTATKDLPYLNACISEGLRTCSPVPAGVPRLVPRGGAIVCGRYLPENVREPTPLLRMTKPDLTKRHNRITDSGLGSIIQPILLSRALLQSRTVLSRAVAFSGRQVRNYQP